MASSDKSQSQDLSRVISDLAKSINHLNHKIDGLGSGSRPIAGGRKNGGISALDPLAPSLKELTGTIKLTEKAISGLRKGADNVEHSFDELYDTQNDMIKSLVSHSKLSERAQEKLADKLYRNAKASSMLGDTVVKTSKRLAVLENKLEETGRFLSGYSDALKEHSTSQLSAIDDLGQLKKAISALDEELELSADAKELIRKQEWTAAAIAIDSQAKNSEKFRNDVKKTTIGFNSLNNKAKMLGSGFSKAIDTVGAGFVKDALAWGGAIGMITAGAKEAYSHFWQTASAGFGGAFVKLSGSAISLGITLETLTSITKENMTLVGKMGLKGFTDSLKDTQLQLMGLGLTTAEAAKTRGIMNENARLSGTDVKNKTALNTVTQQQISAFETLRAVTGESIESLALQSKAILTDSDAVKILGTLNAVQRVQMLKGINLERARLTTMGLTNDAATSVIKTLQQISNMKTVDRIEGSNKLQAAASLAGLDSNEAAQVARITSKTAANQTDPERALVASFAAKLAKSQDSLNGRGSDPSQGILADVIGETASLLTPVMDGMRQANLGRGMSKDEIDSNKALGTVPKVIAEASAKIETWLQILNSPLVKIAIGVAGIAFLLTKMVTQRKKDLELPDAQPRSGLPRLAAPGDSVQHGGHGASVENAIRNGTQMGNTADPLKRKKKADGFKFMSEEATDYASIQKAKEAEIKKARDFKQYKLDQSDGYGRDHVNKTSIASPALQAKLAANSQRIAAQQVGAGGANFVGPLRTSAPTPSIQSRAASAGSVVKTKVAGAVSSVASGATKVAGFAMKAIPYIGLAVAGFEMFSNAFDAASKAAEIFGIDTKKQSVTTAQKISAGIAGALNTISFGLIPVEGTAKLLNDVATDGAGVLGDYVTDNLEFWYNKAIPALYSGFKTVLGFIGTALVDALSPSTWMAAFSGEGGKGGFVQTVIESLWKGVQFFGVALVKGAIKVGADLVELIVENIPDWMGGGAARKKFAAMKKDSEEGGILGFASTDTKFSDTDTPAQAKARAERAAKRDKPAGGTGGGAGGTVQGTNVADGDNLGLVSSINQALTADQLAAQGVKASPAASKNGSVAAGSPGAAAQGSDSTSTSSSSDKKQAEAPKSQSETLLSNILEKMSLLVDLTDKGLKLAEVDYKTHNTASRTRPFNDQSGYSPSMASFLNMPI